MKKTSRFNIIIILLLAHACGYSSYSRQPEDSLMHYLEIASKNNPGLLQKFTEYKAALQKVKQVGSLPDPELNMGVFFTPMELLSGNQVADIRLMQMFPWFGVLKNARDEMSLMAQAKFESFRDAKLSLFYDVQRTWYELSKYQQDICISESNIAILKTIERLALARFKSPLQAGENSVSGEMRPAGDMAANSSESSGMGSMAGMAVNTGGAAPARASSSMPGNTMSSEAGISGLADLYRIQIEIGDLEDNIASLKNMMQSVTARFNLFLNRPVTSPVSLPDTILPELFDIPLSAVTDSMLANNPMLKMLEQEKQAFEARYRMVKSMSYPMIGLGLDYSIIGKSYMSASAMNGSDMVMPMITFTLPVYRKKYNAMKSEAELLKTAASQGYTETSNTLQAEFYQAVRLFQDALRRQKLYTDQCRLAEKSLNIMLKAFASNNASLTDILRIRQQVLDYKFRQIEAVADYNTAVAWLWKLMANKI